MLQQQTQHHSKHRLVVEIARTDSTVRAAQRLRYRVFAEEMGARLSTREPGIDQDAQQVLEHRQAGWAVPGPTAPADRRVRVALHGVARRTEQRAKVVLPASGPLWEPDLGQHRLTDEVEQRIEAPEIDAHGAESGARLRRHRRIGGERPPVDRQDLRRAGRDVR